MVLRFDAPWEGAFCGYATVLTMQTGSSCTIAGSGRLGGWLSDEVTCVAESADGLAWNKPKLGLCEVGGAGITTWCLRANRPFPMLRSVR